MRNNSANEPPRFRQCHASGICKMPSAATLTVSAERVVNAPEIRVQVVSDEQAFLRLEPVWKRIVDASGADHPFLEFAWVWTWWECFGKGGALRVLVVWAGDEPIAIAP